jgi:tyrosyl-tRNA synthetase
MAGGEAFAFTCPLVKKADGTKFGKTESGNIWLDPKRTSPYLFYQFWVNTKDEDAENYIRTFTFLDQSTVEALIAEHRQNPGLRMLQKRLGKEITIFVHGEQAYEFAVQASEILFRNDTAAALLSLSEEDLLDVMSGVPKVDVPRAELETGKDIISFLAETQILPSKGEARKMLQNGGISINKNKVESLDFIVGITLLLRDQYLFVQRGKNKYFLIKAV